MCLSLPIPPFSNLNHFLIISVVFATHLGRDFHFCCRQVRRHWRESAEGEPPLRGSAHSPHPPHPGGVEARPSLCENKTTEASPIASGGCETPLRGATEGEVLPGGRRKHDGFPAVEEKTKHSPRTVPQTTRYRRRRCHAHFWSALPQCCSAPVVREQDELDARFRAPSTSRSLFLGSRGHHLTQEVE